MPFFQGYVNEGDLEQALRLAAMIRQDGLLAQHICSRLNQQGFPDRTTFLLARQALCGETTGEPENTTSGGSSPSDLE
jgi:phage replication-related protein YjqB (UPF0714/DUF867 family)